MKNPIRSLINSIDAWAAKRVVRVALFGHGLAVSEWESLVTTRYLREKPRVELVNRPSEADVLAIHGPFNALNWNALESWVEGARSGAVILAVGNEVQLTPEGHVQGPLQTLSQFKVSSHLTGHPPTPLEIRDALVCLLQVTHV